MALKSRLAKAAGAEPAGQMRDEKVHTVVARSISKSKYIKYTGPLSKIEMSKKCTPLWREAHFEVNMYIIIYIYIYNTPLLEIERCRKSTRRCGAKHISKSKVQKMWGTQHFWRFRCRFAWQAQGIVHLVKSEQNVRVF